MVSQFILGHFEQERSRLALVEDKITFSGQRNIQRLKILMLRIYYL